MFFAAVGIHEPHGSIALAHPVEFRGAERVECCRERKEVGKVSDKERPAAERLTEAFGEPYREVVRNAVDAQQRNVQLAQGWVESVTGMLESQAEANRALTRAMEAHTNAVEEAIKSQERTSRALAESLEAYKDVIERNTALQEKSTDLVQSFFGDVTGELRQGMQTSQEVSKTLMEGSEKQMQAFQAMLSEAMNSYTNLINAPVDLYRKNLEAFGGQGKQGG
jgi:prophage DNA circulation protein